MYLPLEGDGPRYARLIKALKAAILDGRIAAGARLPPTRELAAELELSRNTVLTAYEQLAAEGFVTSRVGSGTFVAEVTAATRRRNVRPRIPAQSAFVERLRRTHDRWIARRQDDVPFDFKYGEPVIDARLVAAWRRALMRAATVQHFDYPDPRGLPALREAVCDYLARRRGVESEPRDVLIVNGTQQALSLAVCALVDRGQRVIVEEPCYFGVRQVVQAHGARLLPVRTDAEGIVTRDMPARGARLICVTPSHQFPGGAVMSLARRFELLRYAERHDAWIVEDDYDGEFRYDGRPLAALRSLDAADRVLYVGSFSKVLFPGLRLGYIVLPGALSRDFAAAKWLADMGSPAIEQAALAEFIASGAFERHLRRATASLKVRRETLLTGLAELAHGSLEIAGARAGMHVVAWLTGIDRAGCEALITRARRAGLGLYSIAPHYAHPPARPGLILGFAGLSAAQIRAALPVLGACLSGAQRTRPL